MIRLTEYEVVMEGGKRTVRSQVSGGGDPVVIYHDFPDALDHLYYPPSPQGDIPLYSGPFDLGKRTQLNGNIYWRWAGQDRGAFARGTKKFESPDDFFPERDSQLWIPYDVLRIPMSEEGKLPEPPSVIEDVKNQGVLIEEKVRSELGDGEILDEVRFLIPNGWDESRGGGICDPRNPGKFWHGRQEVLSRDWAVTIDMNSECDSKFWKHLRETDGFSFTHTASIRRQNDEPFKLEEARLVIETLGLAMSLALGRQVRGLLPVGYRGGAAVWTDWSSSHVDYYRGLGHSHYLDTTVATSQMVETCRAFLDYIKAHGERGIRILRHAVGYYLSAHSSATSTEPQLALSVSGLQLLATNRFVALGGTSRAQWKKKGNDVTKQIRLLLEDAAIDSTIRPHFSALEVAADRIAKRRSNGPHEVEVVDAVSVIVKIRNSAVHPDPDELLEFDVYEWGEASLHALNWFALMILNEVGYSGQITDMLREPPLWVGQVKAPPWLTASSASPQY